MANGGQSDSLDGLLERARGGEAVAARLLGERLIVGRDAPYQPARGGGLIRLAAERGDVEAMAEMSVLAAVGVGQESDWPEAIKHLRAAAAAGHAGAAAQAALLGPLLDDVEKLLHVEGGRQVLETPRASVFENFLRPDLCNWLIERARPRLARARVYDPSDGSRRELEMRTNSGMGFSLLQTDFILQVAQARVAKAIGLPLLNQEPANILHYEPGEQYLAHYDFLNPEEEALKSTAQRGGQRVTTFLIYLNDDFDGGETEFTRLDFRFKGRQGDGFMFSNVGPDGQPERLSLHAGLAPTRGEKWLLTKWVRNRALPLV